MQKVKYSKFKKWPLLWCEAERHVLMWRIQESQSRYKHEWKDICGDAWSTLVQNLLIVKPDVTIQDRALGSVIGHTPIFPNTAPVCRSTPQNSECCKMQSISIVVSHAEKRLPCAVVQEWKALLDMQNIGLGMRTAASDGCHSKFP
jgi:hypothetical protein